MKKVGNILPVVTLITVLSVFCATSVFSEAAAPVESALAPTLLVDGRTVATGNLVMRDGHTLVWIRDMDKFGWGKTETENDGSVIFRSTGLSITFTPGKNVALVNRLPFNLPTPPVVVDGKLMVPIEFVCQSLGHSCRLTTRPVLIVNSKQKVAPQAQPAPSSAPQQVAAAPVSTPAPAPAQVSAPAPTPPPVPAPKPVASKNWIHGKALYAGSPLQKVKLRLTLPGDELQFVKGQTATTDRQGQYTFSDLPDGEYRVYVYVADNPGYFNRMSEVIKVNGGARVAASDIEMGRVLQPVSPRLGSKVVPINGRLTLMCSTCPSADYYEFSVVDPATGEVVASNSSSRPSALLEASMLENAGEYRWQVKAYDSKDQFIGGSPGAGADPWIFKLAGQGEAQHTATENDAGGEDS